MILKTAWFEKKVPGPGVEAWGITYQVISPDEARELSRWVSLEGRPDFFDPGQEAPLPGQPGNFEILVDQTLPEGANLLLYLHHPKLRPSLVAAVEVLHCALAATSPRDQYRLSLRILAMARGTLRSTPLA